MNSLHFCIQNHNSRQMCEIFMKENVFGTSKYGDDGYIVHTNNNHCLLFINLYDTYITHYS